MQAVPYLCKDRNLEYPKVVVAPVKLVKRVGYDPTTNGLKGRYSTS